MLSTDVVCIVMKKDAKLHPIPVPSKVWHQVSFFVTSYALGRHSVTLVDYFSKWCTIERLISSWCSTVPIQIFLQTHTGISIDPIDSSYFESKKKTSSNNYSDTSDTIVTLVTPVTIVTIVSPTVTSHLKF